jgi:hypothetical protein
MSHPLLAIVIATAYAVVFIFVLALCVAAAKRPPVASRTDRLLNDELPDRLFVTLDPMAGPPAERRRA